MAEPSASHSYEQQLLDTTHRLREATINQSENSSLIDTEEAISAILDGIEKLPKNIPSVYVDLEGTKLSRHGSISILQVHIRPRNRTYLIDIHTMKDAAFTARSPTGFCLQEILESRDIPKVFFDARNDSDALFSHFKIRLQNVHDLQLMELATRSYYKKHIVRLAKCIKQDLSLSPMEVNEWKKMKEKGRKAFLSEFGGSYEAFNERPLAKDLVVYCTQDVHFLPALWTVYNNKLTPQWREEVTAATNDRIIQSQSADYEPHGQHKTLAPKGWDQKSNWRRKKKHNPPNPSGRYKTRSMTSSSVHQKAEAGTPQNLTRNKSNNDNYSSHSKHADTRGDAGLRHRPVAFIRGTEHA